MQFDRQVARLHNPLRAVAQDFVLVRLTRMRGVDLDLFDFDYDLTWMAFFLDPDGRVLGRYGGRDASSSESKVSLAGLKYALDRALARYNRFGGETPPNPRDGPATRPGANGKAPRTVEDFAAVKRLPDRACIHCHQVY